MVRMYSLKQYITARQGGSLTFEKYCEEPDCEAR